jgi:hypothetical protein
MQALPGSVEHIAAAKEHFNLVSAANTAGLALGVEDLIEIETEIGNAATALADAHLVSESAAESGELMKQIRYEPFARIVPAQVLGIVVDSIVPVTEAASLETALRAHYVELLADIVTATGVDTPSITVAQTDHEC